MRAQIGVYQYPKRPGHPKRSDRLKVYFNAADLMAKVDGLHTTHRQQSLTISFHKIDRHELVLHVGKAPGRSISFEPGKREDRFLLETNSTTHRHVADLLPTTVTSVRAIVDGNVIRVPMPTNPVAPGHKSQQEGKTPSPQVKGPVEIYIRDEIVTVSAALADFIMTQRVS